MENFIVAISNFPAILPIYTSIINNDLTTTVAILFVALASFFSHIVENHKHGMPGIGYSMQTSYFLNRLDVLGCFFVVLRLSYIFYEKYGISFAPIIKYH